MARSAGLCPKYGYPALLPQGIFSCASAIHPVVVHLDSPNFSPCALAGRILGNSASSRISVSRPF